MLKTTGKGVSPSQAVPWMLGAVEAVEYCHAAGVIHGDLKPSNLLADEEGRIHLIDFGLARRLAETSGEVGGTAPYMAPELIDSRWGEISPAVDIYGLGGVLYTLLAGRPPYAAASREATLTLVASLDAAPPMLESGEPLREALNTICMRCLEKDPRRRYVSARELATELRAASAAHAGAGGAPDLR